MFIRPISCLIPDFVSVPTPNFKIVLVRAVVLGTFCTVFCTVFVTMVCAADELLPPADNAAQISGFLQDKWEAAEMQPAAASSDRTFVRRAYLDLVGRIPTVGEASNYLADGRSDKREQLVRVLLHSEDYVQHFADTFDTLLMGRGSSKDYDERIKHQWRAYLERVFRDNRPWNEVVNEILLARPEKQEDRGAVWFLFERQDKYQQIAEAVAPAFFGVRIECAQCHDHMMAAEIEQAHYWGLTAFFNRSKNVHTKNGPRVSESAIGGFSDFANLEGDSSPNVLTFLSAMQIEEARPKPDEKQDDSDDLYDTASVEHDPRVPRFSRREKFVSEIAEDHPLIARAFVNRVWAMLLGRGIVHPFDEMDSVHTPSHPELLDYLAEDFRKSNYDIRRLVNSIVLCRSYGLQSNRSDGMDDESLFAWGLERQLTAEQFARSAQLAVRGKFQNDEPLIGKVRQTLTAVLPDESVTTIKDALFLTNNKALNDFIKGSNLPDHLIPRLVAFDSNSQRAELLFETVFCRSATSAESGAVEVYLQGHDDTLTQRLQQVVWAMLTSAEFRFNH